MPVVVIEKNGAQRIKASNPPQSISILRTKVLGSRPLPWGKDLQMSCLVDILLKGSVVSHSLHEQQFLGRTKSTLSFEKLTLTAYCMPTVVMVLIEE